MVAESEVFVDSIDVVKENLDEIHILCPLLNVAMILALTYQGILCEHLNKVCTTSTLTSVPQTP